MAVHTPAAYGFYPQNVPLQQVVQTLNRSGFGKEDICMMVSPKHPLATVVREANILQVERGAGAETAGMMAWLMKFGAVMIPTVSVLMVTHAIEVMVWSLVYWMFEAAPADADLVYFAFVNYTTLGYGDVVPLERWRLLGPITAMNGILLFGWSTAVIFEVLRRTLARNLDISPTD